MIVNIKRKLLWGCVYSGVGAVCTVVYQFLGPHMLPGKGGAICAFGIAVLVGLAYMAMVEQAVERAPEWWRSHKEAVERTRTLIALAEIAPPASTIWPQPH